MMSVYRLVVPLVILAGGALLRCFSSYSPVFGFLCLKMKWTWNDELVVYDKADRVLFALFVAPHLSGPNMMT